MAFSVNGGLEIGLEAGIKEVVLEGAKLVDSDKNGKDLFIDLSEEVEGGIAKGSVKVWGYDGDVGKNNWKYNRFNWTVGIIIAAYVGEEETNKLFEETFEDGIIPTKGTGIKALELLHKVLNENKGEKATYKIVVDAKGYLGLGISFKDNNFIKSDKINVPDLKKVEGEDFFKVEEVTTKGGKITPDSKAKKSF